MTYQDILDFWFMGLDPDQHAPSKEQMGKWFRGGPELDQILRDEYSETLEKAKSGELDAWAQTPEGLGALIVVLDQFPRNIFRGKPEAFSYDPIALKWAKHGIENGFSLQVHPLLTTFMYLPLEHSESLEDQELCVKLMRELSEKANPDAHETYEGFVDYAVKHHEIIAEFGRFPHRNHILGRENTAAETEFLKRDDVHFGQKVSSPK